MITLADMIDSGIEFQGDEISVRHYNFYKDEIDFKMELDKLREKQKSDERLEGIYNSPVKYIYPLAGVKGVLVIEVDDKD